MSSFFDGLSTPEYSKFIHMSRYARWIESEKRRETWPETVNRYVSFFKGRFPELQDAIEEEIRDPILKLEVMPSMRCMMTAGKALEHDEVAGYNCSYLAIDNVRAFDEIMYILMCGTGVGFSVERQYINKLPEVAEEFHLTDTVIVVKDSKIGWAAAYRELLSLLYSGQIPKWDLSKVREAGARLKTFGGRASGPGPLNSLFEFAVELFKKAAGRKLTSLECHDLVCKTADCVVSGGVRRSALISLSNLSDDRMREAKMGQYWETNPQRDISNNSACYTERPDFNIFLKEMVSLYQSKRGERGIFNRQAAKYQAARNGRRDVSFDFGTNPCSEIILRSCQFCNLSEVVIRPTDTIEMVAEKVRIATILGTLQSSLTNFRYIRKIWKKNTEEERLLGVSLTGIMDNPHFNNPDNEMLPGHLDLLRQIAIDTNKEWAEKLGIPASTAITCVKPSGTVSQLVDSSSGIHPRFSKYYIRTVRAMAQDPLAQMMEAVGFPVEVDVINPNNRVFSFPIKAPDHTVTAGEVSALDQLRLWKIYQEHWCEHKPSITVYYRDDEFFGVAQWIWDNFNMLSGITLLPHQDHVYKQAPYQAIDEDTYYALLDKMPKDVDWSYLKEFETDDTTSSSKELACSAGVCEVVDIV